MEKLFRSLLLAGSLFLAVQTSFSQQVKKDITLEDIWAKGTFRPQTISGLNSMKDGNHYSSLESDNKESFIIEYEYKSGKITDTIFRSSWLVTSENKKNNSFDNYQFSADESKILISTESEKIYRHSTKETNYIWNRKTKKLSVLSDKGKQMYASFSPDGFKVAFVRDNNIFIKNLTDNKELQITTDGLFNHIINGATDWVYEEEFSFDQAFFWSPDGASIAYYRFDESGVKEFSMNEYGTLYPKENRFKYPKAGEANSIVSIHVYNLNFGNTITVDVGKETDQYIPRIKWTMDANVLSLQRMNRHQNKLELLFADAQTGKSKVILTEENKAYIDITDNLTFLNDKKHFIWSSEKDGFHHLYLYDLNGKPINQITKGNWDLMELNGIDEKNQIVFYTSSENAATDRDLYSIKMDGSNKKKLSTGKGSNNALFSEGCNYYINTFSDANTPYYISLHTANGKLIRILEDNAALKKILEDYSLSKKEFFKFTTSEGVELNGWMIKPSNFDEHKKYPVFMTVYGGPGVNTVNNGWENSGYLWHQYLAQKGYIVVSVDNRGTGARGEEFKKCTYKQLGKLETQDQIEAAKYLGALPYVDKNRIGIQGWSYGGYMTSLCMTKGADYFKAGIAVAPVINWRYYDSIYTERYLETPQENPEGYDDNSPINHVRKLKGNYLLIHGTADDNVHFQNAAEMIKALVEANKQFDLFIYPDKNHGIYGGNTRLHLYTKMTNFILENL